MINSDVEDAIFKHYGISTTKEGDIVSRPKICKICDLPNSYDSKICSKCGKPLDLKSILEKEEKNEVERQHLEDKLEDLEKNMESIISKKINEYSTQFIKNLEKMFDDNRNRVNQEMKERVLELFRKMAANDKEFQKMKGMNQIQ